LYKLFQREKQTMLHDIQPLLDGYNSLSTSLELSKKRSVSQSHLLDVQKQYADFLTSTSSDKKLAQVKRHAQSINNLLSGAVRGLQQQEISRTELLQTISSGSKFLDLMNEEYVLAAKRKPKTENVDLDETVEIEVADQVESSLSDSALRELKVLREKIEKQTFGVDTNDGDAEKLKAKFEEWTQLRKKCPTTMGGKNFGLVELPVIPMYVDFTLGTSEVLTKLGIRHTMFEGYAVLERQKILYFDADVIKKEHKMSAEEYAEDLVEFLNLRLSEKVVLASSLVKHSPRNKSIAMFWLMPNRVLTSLLKRQHQAGGKKGKSAALRDWDFPFERS
jgi:hypothetical protein